MTRTRLAVLGSPIAHSKSPALHSAAYRVLGLDWSYDAIEVTAAGLPAFLRSCDATWRGLSLTMPLKRDVLPLLDGADDLATLTGGANTVLFADSPAADGALPGTRLLGFNTDVHGITAALRSHGVPVVSRVRLLGAGATAASVVAAVAGLGAREVLISTRSPERAAPVRELAGMLGLEVTVGALDVAHSAFEPDLVVSCLPNGTVPDIRFDDEVLEGATLFDVAYDPWPSALASRWYAARGHVVPGIEMLVGQALVQVRVFVGGSPDVPLEDEAAVLASMRESVGLPPTVL